MSKDCKYRKARTVFVSGNRLNLYNIEFEENDILPMNDYDSVTKSALDYLRSQNIRVLDIQSLTSGSKSHGLFVYTFANGEKKVDGPHAYSGYVSCSNMVGTKCFITNLTLGFITSVPITKSMRTALCDHKTYTSINPSNPGTIRMTKQINYNVDKLKMCLCFMNKIVGHSSCGCGIHKQECYPLVGCYNGEYLEEAESRRIGIASWNHKTPEARESIKKLTDCEVRTASIEFNEKHIWSFGFGW